jgi:hypothetical protein
MLGIDPASVGVVPLRGHVPGPFFFRRKNMYYVIMISNFGKSSFVYGPFTLEHAKSEKDRRVEFYGVEYEIKIVNEVEGG